MSNVHNPRTRQITDHTDRRHRDGAQTDKQSRGVTRPELSPEFTVDRAAVERALRRVDVALRCGDWQQAASLVAAVASKHYLGETRGPTLGEADAKHITTLVGYWLRQGQATIAVTVLERRSRDPDLQRGNVTRESHPAELELCERTLRRLESLGIRTVAALVAEFEVWYPLGRGPRQIGNTELATIYAELNRHGFVGPAAKSQRAKSYLHNGERR